METRYYIAGKQSWSDVTIQITKAPEKPSKGDVVKMGKLAMTIKDIVDGNVHGKPVTKVYIEEVSPAVANLLETIDMLDNPTIIDINGVNEAAGKAWLGMDTRGQRSADAATGGVGVVYRPQTLELGTAFRSALSNIGPGFGAQVADFGDAITVTLTYSNAKTGRCASQSYVVLWQPDRNPKYPYKVMSSVARYRNCADYGQAIGFIRSKASALPGATGSLL